METINSYLPELMAFHQVAKSGGFTQAAEKLGLSKSQLSKQVAKLETLLKAQLFHRTTRKISLTEEGKHLLQYSENIVNLSREAAESMKALVTEEKGLIRITAPSSLGDWFAPEILELFREKFPGLKVEIDLSNTKRNLIEENYDFAFRAMDETNSDFIARFLGHIKDVVIATPAYLKKNKIDLTDPTNLKFKNCLIHSHIRAWNQWKLQKGSRDLVVDVQGSYACSSYATTRLLCLKGLGIARVPYYLVKEDLEKGRLVHLYSDYSIATHPLYLVYPGKGYNMRKQKLVKDIIMEWMKGQKVMFA
ncbi:MAG TPA: LysR family transcriptional regulator [Bacteriovoracaceae bacterium]|nr:LysR family transcriptional regulator [Bacteriovoracaceae bacterium]